MGLLRNRSDGGEDSRVTSWGLEMKGWFSIVLLRFEPSNRENYHSHAFNAVTLWLRGRVTEERIMPNRDTRYSAGDIKYTSRANVHKIHCRTPAWALSIRGPWKDQWSEYNPARQEIKLTHGRKTVSS